MMLDKVKKISNPTVAAAFCFNRTFIVTVFIIMLKFFCVHKIANYNRGALFELT
jgi:hypothetical protein